MVAWVYSALITVVFVFGVWSVYLQRELIVNSVTLKVGDAVSWLIAIILGIGVGVIIATNFLPLQVWKVFIFLIVMLGVDGVILWLTATFVHAIASHKIPQSYRIQHKKREDRNLLLVGVLSLVIIIVTALSNEPLVSIASFLLVPIIVLIERSVTLKARIREIGVFDTYTEEEVTRSEDNLRKAIEDGRALKPKDNVLKKIIKRDKKRYSNMVNEALSKEESEKLVKQLKQNDELNEEMKSNKDKVTINKTDKEEEVDNV